MRAFRLLVAVLLGSVGLAVPLPAHALPPSAPPDVYTYLENPEMVGEGQEPPHADLTAADSRWNRSLVGRWRLRMANRPEEVPPGFYADGDDTSAWPLVAVPHTWQT